MRNKGIIWAGLSIVVLFAMTLYVRFLMSDMQIAKTALKYYNNYDEAIQRFQKVLEKDPNNVEVHLYLGLAHGKSGNYNEAIKEFRWIRQRYPDFHFSASIRNDIGLFYYVLEQYPEAIDEFTHATLLKPNFVEAYFNLGTAYSALEQTQKAIECYQTVIKIDPRHSYSHWNLAVNLEKTNDIRGAIVHWKKYLELTPGVFRSPEVSAHIVELEQQLNKK